MELSFVLLGIFWINTFCIFQSAIIEKTSSVCNGECSSLLMQCPGDHKIAIREALYGVHSTTSVCPQSFECDDAWKDVCCEMAPGRDCLFPYPLKDLEGFHRDCSGNLQCDIVTKHRPKASPACSPVEHRNVSSYSLFDYVCINNTFTADICTPRAVSLRGRTLFAMFDARHHPPPPSGSVCACAATPTIWTGSGRVSAFVVDLRLKSLNSGKCSDSKFTMESPPQTKEIPCRTSTDPYFPYPFVSILNTTTGVISRLVINEAPPEFVWIGFEASQDEEIQLTCGLQPAPVTTTSAPPLGLPGMNENNQGSIQKTPTEGFPGGNQDRASLFPVALACGIIGGLVVIGVVVLIGLWMFRRQPPAEKTNRLRTNNVYNEEHLYADVDGEAVNRPNSLGVEPFYHTVGLSGSTLDVYSSPWDSRSNRKLKTNGGCMRDDDSDLSDMYVTPEEVRRQKSKSKTKGPTEEYVAVSEIRKKKNQKKVTFNKNLEQYDRLNYRTSTSDEAAAGYSHLGIIVTDYDEEINTALREAPKIPEKHLEEFPLENGVFKEEVENVQKSDAEQEEETTFCTNSDKMADTSAEDKSDNDASSDNRVNNEIVYDAYDTISNHLRVENNEDDRDSTRARASDEDSGLSTDEDKEEEITLNVPKSDDNRPPSPYALASSIPTEEVQ